MSNALVSIVRHIAAIVVTAATLVMGYLVCLVIFVATAPILAIVRLGGGRETAKRLTAWLLTRVAATTAIFETMAENITATLI
jgi:hypothetical protein|uniref:Uncharacterized protein n=1 Tax=Siphoviridae sp. ctHEr2 TaxID=2826229 RepID=A0A8S5NFK4_9CAUD|nr:MAG TPA: hypothetical protein [Siphoviridae sp. ctHEr2]